MGAAIWAAFEERWWLVGLCAIAAGVGYALGGVRWMRSYRGDPAAHSRGESVLLLVVLVVPLFAGAVLLRWAHADGGAGPSSPCAGPAQAEDDVTAVSEVEFAVLRDGLGVSDSVLSKHVATLADAGYVRSRKGAHEGRRTTWWRSPRPAGRCSAITSQCCARSSTASTDPHEGLASPEPSPMRAARLRSPTLLLSGESNSRLQPGRSTHSRRSIALRSTVACTRWSLNQSASARRASQRKPRRSRRRWTALFGRRSLHRRDGGQGLRRDGPRRPRAPRSRGRCPDARAKA